MMQALLIAMLMYHRIIEHERQDYTADWEMLLILLENEINQYDVLNITKNQINLTDGKTNFQIIVQNNKIFKRPGHHPYSYNIKSWSLNHLGDLIEIQVIYENNQSFMGWINIEK